MPPATVDALRSALAVADRAGVGRAYPEPLRRAVVAYTFDARARGESITSISVALGVPSITLQRWLRGAAASPFRAAVVVEPALTSASPSATVVVHGPRGLRVEGLDVAGVAELLRRLS